MLRRAFDAKFWAHITTIQAALPHLAADGSITLLGAVTARAGMPGTAGIAAINGAVEALVKPLAVELAPIRVNGVSPGLVDTPWWSGVPDEARQAYFAQAAAQLPTGRVATAEEIADVVVLAATNPNLTGTVIEADGGARLVSVG
jgi:NAD(P)-dependent dehydrogenase (short-subunit alcohol dehydrogenase family)